MTSDPIPSPADESREAAKALASVRETDRRMAQKMTWPFQRHALFGVGEGLIVMGIGSAGTTGIGAVGVGFALMMSLMYQDKERYGMFVSGYIGTRTRPLMWFLIGFVVLAMGAAIYLRPETGTHPAVVLIGLAVAAVMTWGSIKWEKLYRAELLEGDGR
jgi:hypothetical protein